jgi:hypothetical protein
MAWCESCKCYVYNDTSRCGQCGANSWCEKCLRGEDNKSCHHKELLARRVEETNLDALRKIYPNTNFKGVQKTEEHKNGKSEDMKKEIVVLVNGNINEEPKVEQKKLPDINCPRCNHTNKSIYACHLCWGTLCKMCNDCTSRGEGECGKEERRRESQRFNISDRAFQGGEVFGASPWFARGF